ncbi:MAG: hypothetical protein ACRD8W_25390, partial [Nitrososphaeraceae archaeon]
MKIIFEYQDEQVSGHVKNTLDYENVSECNSVKPCNKESSTGDLIDGNLIRENLPIPDISEATVIRHYTNLSRLNYGIDVGFYPLGSCTMKYNPKINEDISSLEGFKDLHPYSGTKFI